MEAIQQKYEVVIGLEIHAQLLTQTKIYNSDAATFGGEANTHVGVITLAHPGTLPKLNKVVVEQAIKMGLACHSKISRHQVFDRKNYFYPDLPKGYQLTQDRTPICVGGHITIKTKVGNERKIELNRIHIEEDAGKSIHLEEEIDTLLDFNRAGVALIEIVTEPVIYTAEEAGAVFAEIRKLVRYLGICDGNMEEGSLRCDANVSVRLKGATALGKKVEIKNMNSVRNVQRAVIHEAERQIVLLEKEEEIVSETRTFDADTGKTYGMRTKEELNDYRYFPDPDLSPLFVSEEWLGKIQAEMPILPQQMFEKFVTEYGLPKYDAHVLTESKELAFYFESVAQLTNRFKSISNWLMGPVKSYLNEVGKEIDQIGLQPDSLHKLIDLVESGKVSFAVAVQSVFPEVLKSSDEPLVIAQRLNLIQDSNADAILLVIKEVIKEFPLKVEEYKNGKKGIVAMFMGEVMKRTKGKADPKLANQLLTDELSKIKI
ncbi:MAG: Asp-tRNA(Asn)/Glu-tRNA(Gln) amidotransferase subunit GatB [Cytophagales bacterium]